MIMEGFLMRHLALISLEIDEMVFRVIRFGAVTFCSAKPGRNQQNGKAYRLDRID